MFARKPAVGFANFFFAGLAAHPEGLIVVLLCHRRQRPGASGQLLSDADYCPSRRLFLLVYIDELSIHDVILRFLPARRRACAVCTGRWSLTVGPGRAG